MCSWEHVVLVIYFFEKSITKIFIFSNFIFLILKSLQEQTKSFYFRILVGGFFLIFVYFRCSCAWQPGMWELARIHLPHSCCFVLCVCVWFCFVFVFFLLGDTGHWGCRCHVTSLLMTTHHRVYKGSGLSRVLLRHALDFWFCSQSKVSSISKLIRITRAASVWQGREEERRKGGADHVANSDMLCWSTPTTAGGTRLGVDWLMLVCTWWINWPFDWCLILLLAKKTFFKIKQKIWEGKCRTVVAIYRGNFKRWTGNTLQGKGDTWLTTTASPSSWKSFSSLTHRFIGRKNEQWARAEER